MRNAHENFVKVGLKIKPNRELKKALDTIVEVGLKSKPTKGL